MDFPALVIAAALTLLILGSYTKMLNKNIAQMSILVLISETLCVVMTYINNTAIKVIMSIIALILMLIALVICVRIVKNRIMEIKKAK